MLYGIVGIFIIISICIVPIVKLTVLMLIYYCLSAISQPIADSKIVDLLEQVGNSFKMLLAILITVSVLLIIGTTLVIKITNSRPDV